MFSEGPIIMIIGIVLALSVILGSVYFVYKMFSNQTQEILVRFILMVFTALVALFFRGCCKHRFNSIKHLN